jgi:hypothetical protein
MIQPRRVYGPLRVHQRTEEEVVLLPELGDSIEEAAVNGLKTDQEDTDFGWLWRRSGDVVELSIMETGRLTLHAKAKGENKSDE